MKKYKKAWYFPKMLRMSSVTHRFFTLRLKKFEKLKEFILRLFKSNNSFFYSVFFFNKNCSHELVKTKPEKGCSYEVIINKQKKELAKNKAEKNEFEKHLNEQKEEVKKKENFLKKLQIELEEEKKKNEFEKEWIKKKLLEIKRKDFDFNIYRFALESSQDKIKELEIEIENKTLEVLIAKDAKKGSDSAFTRFCAVAFFTILISLTVFVDSNVYYNALFGAPHLTEIIDKVMEVPEVSNDIQEEEWELGFWEGVLMVAIVAAIYYFGS